MTIPNIIEHDAIAQLRQQVVGNVLLPGDTHYDEARVGFNLVNDQRPAVIVVAQDAHDVALAIRFANRTERAIGIMSTGHGYILPADDAVLIVTSQLNEIAINAEEETVVVGAGLHWGTVLEVAQQHGLTPLLGSSPTVGVVGYTLGGGMGWLARKYGLALDSVIYFEIVTASGELVRASASENSDLFWALRGGGGNFGVVTAIKFRLYPVTTVYGGNLFYGIEDARAVFQRYREWVRNAPDELTSSVLVMNFPPIPEMPDILRGKSYVMVRGCYAGDLNEGAALLQYWRAWKTPVIDDFKVMPMMDIATVSSDPVNPLPGLGIGQWLHEINDDVIEAICAHVPGHTPVVFAEIRHAGGAIAAADKDTAAYGNRDALYSLSMIGVTPTQEAQEGYLAYANMIKVAMKSAATGGVYLNFVDGKSAREQTAAAYSAESYERLQSIKGKYDPENRFHHSFDLTPVKDR